MVESCQPVVFSIHNFVCGRNRTIGSKRGHICSPGLPAFSACLPCCLALFVPATSTLVLLKWILQTNIP
jgi:hypothetical protein